MNIRLFAFLFILMLAATSANAQITDNPGTSFALLGGINFQNLNGKNSDGSKIENELILGYHAGINAQIPIAPQFFFQPGLLFTTKGAQNTEGDFTSTYHLSYLELPLNLVYKGQLGNGYVLVGLGPYLAYGIGGKATYEGGAVTLESDIEFQNEVAVSDPAAATYFRAFDAGGNIFAGYEFGGGLFFQLNTQLGMIKINPDDKRIPNDNTAVKNTGFGLSIGYRF